MSDVIERFLRSLVEHDWHAFESCLAGRLHGVGPYGDTYSSKADYVAFLSDLMPTLAGYEMEVTRVSYADGVGFAELSETVEVEGALLRTPECLSFDLTDDGQISRVEVFTQGAPRRCEVAGQKVARWNVSVTNRYQLLDIRGGRRSGVEVTVDHPVHVRDVALLARVEAQAVEAARLHAGLHLEHVLVVLGR